MGGANVLRKELNMTTATSDIIKATSEGIERWSEEITVSLHENGKGYLVSGDSRIKEDEFFPRVTSVLDILEKYGLRTWAMRMALAYVEDNLAEATRIHSFDKALDLTLKGAAVAHEERRDTAADFGTEAHALLQQLFIDPNTVVPDEFRSVVHAWMQWLDESELKVLSTEQQLYYSDTTSSMAPITFAGTADLIALDKQGMPVICDWKTGANIYPEYALQMAAYSMGLGFCGVGRFLNAEQIANTRAIVVKLPKEEDGKLEFKEVNNLFYHEEIFAYACKLKQWKSDRNKWMKGN